MCRITHCCAKTGVAKLRKSLSKSKSMFCYYRRALLCLNQNPNLNTIVSISAPFSPLLQPFTSSSTQCSFTFKYLVNSVGLSQETASKLSTRVRLDNSLRPDSVLALFRSHGFSNAELCRIIQTYPELLSVRPIKTILPKLNFLLSKGASSSDLVHIVTKNPRLLYFGLQHSITPCYDFIKSFLLSDQSTVLSIKSCPSILYSKNLTLNVQILLENGVPQSKVTLLLRYWASILIGEPPSFKKAVYEVKELGFDPNKTTFVIALRAKVSRESLWEKKVDLFKKWGWSEDIVVSAFLRYPWCMLASKDNINATMEFCVNQMGWESLVLAKYPVLIMLSLEKRVIPRAFVLQFLQSKGLIKDVKSSTPFKVSEKVFLKKYVNCFEEEASQLLKLYEEKRDLPR